MKLNDSESYLVNVSEIKAVYKNTIYRYEKTETMKTKYLFFFNYTVENRIHKKTPVIRICFGSKCSHILWYDCVKQRDIDYANLANAVDPSPMVGVSASA